MALSETSRKWREKNKNNYPEQNNNRVWNKFSWNQMYAPHFKQKHLGNYCPLFNCKLYASRLHPYINGIEQRNLWKILVGILAWCCCTHLTSVLVYATMRQHFTEYPLKWHVNKMVRFANVWLLRIDKVAHSSLQPNRAKRTTTKLKNSRYTCSLWANSLIC